MRYFYVKLVICCLTVFSQSEKSFQTKTRCKRTTEDSIKASESRGRSKEFYSEYNQRDYDEQRTDLPVTFQAPNFQANDYWRNKHGKFGYSNRRTFFEEYPRFEKKSNFGGMNSFYQLMTSLFTQREEHSSMPEVYRQGLSHVTHPYLFDGPYGFASTEPNYIPPPKPIRASVIKLETITRSPNLHSVGFETTTKYYPHFGNILNHVLIEKSKHQPIEDLGFHHYYHRDRDFTDKTNHNPNVFYPVLPKPVDVQPTTIRPYLEYSKFFQNHTLLYDFPRKRNKSHKYPSSIQDQLPPLEGYVKIPYISATNISFVTKIPTQTSRFNSRIVFPNNDDTTNRLRNNFGRYNQLKKKKSVREPLRAIDSRTPNFEHDVTTIIYPIQKLRGTLFKKTSPTVEIITNLTVEGLSKPEKENANIHNYVNFFNMSNLISYEKNKLQNIPQSEWKKFLIKSSENKIPKSTAKPPGLVNINDELSLDAKILKDTNWDGFATSTLRYNDSEEKENIAPIDKNQTRLKEMTTIATTVANITKQGLEPSVLPNDYEFEKTTKETNFWVVETPKPTTTEVPITEIPTTTIIPTTPFEFITALEPVASTSSMEYKETTQVFATTQEISTFRPFGVRRPKETTTDSTKATTESASIVDVFEMTTVTEKMSTSQLRRKYVRRLKTQKFTPYPTSELQRKVINRNNFPKRQKPNITLAFGNKNIIKARESYTRDEVMKFSDEDIRKRKRKTGKRRQLFKRIRTTTTTSE